MNDNKDSRNTLCLGTDAARSEKVVAVAPGSLNAHPPIAMYTFSFGSLCFKSIIRLYRFTSSREDGAILNVFGSMTAKAKLTWV
jgi:hypothetical protein